LVESRAEGERERGRTDRVVDVVEAGKRELDAARPLGRHEVEGGAFETMQLDLARGDVERRPRVVAARAAVVTEVPDVGRGVVVGRAAADAVLRVGGVLQRRARDAGIV